MKGTKKSRFIVCLFDGWVITTTSFIDAYVLYLLIVICFLFKITNYD